MKLPLTQRRHARVAVLGVKGDSLGQAAVSFAPLVNGLEHAARVLNVPEDAAVGCALVRGQALEPVRVSLAPVLVRDGVVLVPPSFMLVRGKTGSKEQTSKGYRPVGQTDVAVAHNGLP